MSNATELFGRKIKELGKLRGLSQEQLGEQIGIDQKHMSKIELGNSYPSLDRLMRISEVLHAPLPTLFDFEHLETAPERAQRVDQLVQKLAEKDQKIVLKIVKAFLESCGKDLG
jgi:transcriptional regulator with XRE-family HTH domain